MQHTERASQCCWSPSEAWTLWSFQGLIMKSLIERNAVDKKSVLCFWNFIEKIAVENWPQTRREMHGNDILFYPSFFSIIQDVKDILRERINLILKGDCSSFTLGNLKLKPLFELNNEQFPTKEMQKRISKTLGCNAISKAYRVLVKDNSRIPQNECV